MRERVCERVAHLWKRIIQICAMKMEKKMKISNWSAKEIYDSKWNRKSNAKQLIAHTAFQKMQANPIFFKLMNFIKFFNLIGLKAALFNQIKAKIIKNYTCWSTNRFFHFLLIGRSIKSKLRPFIQPIWTKWICVRCLSVCFCVGTAQCTCIHWTMDFASDKQSLNGILNWIEWRKKRKLWKIKIEMNRKKQSVGWSAVRLIDKWMISMVTWVFEHLNAKCKSHFNEVFMNVV